MEVPDTSIRNEHGVRCTPYAEDGGDADTGDVLDLADGVGDGRGVGDGGNTETNWLVDDVWLLMALVGEAATTVSVETRFKLVVPEVRPVRLVNKCGS